MQRTVPATGRAINPACCRCPLPLQYEVEQYYLSQGLLFFTSPGFYWLGLRSDASTWPLYTWLNLNVKIPDRNYGGYEHWGISRGRRQPDNAGGAEWCAGANYSLSYSEAWGWSDTNCTTAFPYICRTDGEPAAAVCL